ncbi:MAG: MFS transporter [Actinomycetota bacterium]|nr:MFS transporter [Actinomycetota bacterium]
MSLLRDRRVSALLAAEVISSLGTQMTWLALPWFVLRTTGSPQQMTWVIIAEVLPIGVLGFWGGAIASRVGTRRTMLVCDIARAPLLAAIPILHAAGLLPFPALLALVAATGVFIAPYFAVQRAVVPELVGEEQGDVAYATAFFQAANRLTIFLGPPAAGVLIAVVGAAQILYIDAATYVVSFALVAAFIHPPEVPAPEEAGGVLAGVRFVMRDKLLRVWTPAFTLGDVCFQLLFASLPVLVVTQYHANPRILGWLFGALGGGALVGALASMRIVRRVEPLTLGAVAFMFQMLSLWTLAFSAPWEVPFAGMACAGFFMSLVNAPIQALVMLRIPRHLRTQGIAAFGVFQCIGAPIGLVAAGFALARYDTHSVLTVVLALQTVAVLTIVTTALAERSALRAAAVDSPA